MINKPSIWHYPRTELAQRLIQSINVGLVHSFVIFAPRRIGKTEFLTYDLKPLAQSNNYFVIYFNFYTDLTTGQSPANLFKNKLREAINNSIFDKIQIKEVKLSWCTINLKSGKKIDELDVLELITLLCVKLQKKNMQLLLLLDEIQELEFRSESQPLIAGLRTALDLNKETVKVVFTGSSEAGLKKMFQDSKAPFFHFSSNIDFPYFGKDFTDFLAGVYHELIHKNVDPNELYDVFCKLNKVTLYIREVLNLYLLNPNLSLMDCYDLYSAKLNDVNNYMEKWLKLTDSEKAILLAISNKTINNFYSQTFIDFSNTYGFTVSRGSIQSGLKKLQDLAIILPNSSKQYEIIDNSFESWVKTQYT